jgi:hypothetical protein
LVKVEYYERRRNEGQNTYSTVPVNQGYGYSLYDDETGEVLAIDTSFNDDSCFMEAVNCSASDDEESYNKKILLYVYSSVTGLYDLIYNDMEEDESVCICGTYYELETIKEWITNSGGIVANEKC